MSETVKLHLVIEINVDGTEDTGLTVEQWNALADSERAKLADQIWSAAAEDDKGGIRVVTPGAVGL